VDAAVFAVLNDFYPSAPGAWDALSDPRGAAVIVLVVLAVGWRTRSWFPVLAAAIAVAAIDPLCSYMLKPIAGRERPCAVLDAAYGPVEPGGTLECGSGRSMPSNHAANTMAAAFASASGSLVGLSLLVGASRVASAQHWPSDVVVGWSLGAGAGLAARWLVGRARAAL
jgi:undecaprenyl-diphosphatase